MIELKKFYREKNLFFMPLRKADKNIYYCIIYNTNNDVLRMDEKSIREEYKKEEPNISYKKEMIEQILEYKGY